MNSRANPAIRSLHVNENSTLEFNSMEEVTSSAAKFGFEIGDTVMVKGLLGIDYITLKSTNEGGFGVEQPGIGWWVRGEIQGYALNKFGRIENTIEELVNNGRKYKVGDVVELLGYYSAGDGAGHKRKITSSDDGSGVQLTGGLWANIVHNGEVNVSWLGWVSTQDPLNNARRIRKFFDYFTVSGAVNVLADFGEVEVDVTTDIYGVGYDTAGGHFKVSGKYNIDLNGSKFIVRSNSSFKYTILNVEKFSGTISGGIFIGDRDTHTYITSPKPSHEWGRCVLVKDSDGVILKNMTISDMTGDCIAVSQTEFFNVAGFLTKNITITGCHLSWSRRNNISITCGLNVVIQNNIITKGGIERNGVLGTNPKMGIDLEAYRERVDNVLIEYERVENVIITNNKFIDNRLAALSAYTAYNVLIENNFSDTTMSVASGGFVKLLNNTLVNKDYTRDYSKAAISCLYLDSDPDNQVDARGSDTRRYNLIQGNTVIGFETAITGSFVDTNILHNYFKVKKIGGLTGYTQNVMFRGNVFEVLGEDTTSELTNLDVRILKPSSRKYINISDNIFRSADYFTRNVSISVDNIDLTFNNNTLEQTDTNKGYLVFKSAENSDITIHNNTLNSMELMNVNSANSTFDIYNNRIKRSTVRGYGIAGNFEGSVIRNNILENANISLILGSAPSNNKITIIKENIINDDINSFGSAFSSKIMNNYILSGGKINTSTNLKSVVVNNIFEQGIKIIGISSSIGNISESASVLDALNTPIYIDIMKDEGVYEDFRSYSLAKIKYDAQQREVQAQQQAAFEQREDQNQTYEEWLSSYPMLLPAGEEPQPSEALIAFKTKYLG